MTSAFVYLVSCSVTNRFRQRLRRLRQPRYLTAFVAGMLYLYVFVFRHALGRSPRVGASPFGGLENISDSLAFAGPLLLWIVVTMAWVMPGSGPAIPFSGAEVQFLFPAPLTRRQLLNYKVIRGQIGPLFGTAVTTLLLRPSSAVKGWMFFTGMLLALTVLRLHLTGVALRRQSLAQHGVQAARRHGVSVAVVIAAAVVVIGTVALDWPRLSVLESGGQVADELKALVSSGPAHWILWPFAAVARLPLAASAAVFLRALPIVLAILALNYFWIVRGDVAFEEASAAYAERQVDRRKRDAAPVRDVRRTPFGLALTGRPEVVFLWKNLILCGRFASWKFLIRFVPIIAVGAMAVARGSSSGVAQTVLFVCLMTTMLAILIGPQSLRCDLRQDLAQFQLLKGWPVRGAALLRGEILAPAVVLSATCWLLILTAAIFIGPEAGAVVLPIDLRHHRFAFAAALALVSPAFIVAQLVLHNGLAVLFPAWVALGASRARGIDAMGQRLLMMAGVVLVLVVSLLPAGLLAAPVVLGIEMTVGDHGLAVLAAAVVIAAVILIESWFALSALGRVFDRTDAAELEPGE